MKLENATREIFAECLGTRFRILPESGAPVEVELIEATALPAWSKKPARREPFSLIFRGPRDLLLPQRTYNVEHDKLGTFPLFFVPIGPDPQGLLYQAVFN